MKKVLKLLDKIVLIPWGLTAVASATDRAIRKKIHGSWKKLIPSNEEMVVIMKIVESVKESAILIKVVTKTAKNEAKE